MSFRQLADTEARVPQQSETIRTGDRLSARGWFGLENQAIAARRMAAWERRLEYRHADSVLDIATEALGVVLRYLRNPATQRYMTMQISEKAIVPTMTAPLSAN
jgi:hypothetical protein